MSHPHPELTAPEPLPEGALRVTPFGGLGEVGRNMTAFEYAGRLLAPAHLPQEQAQRAGHIPTAANVPWSKAANDDGTFKSDDELREIYTEAGVDWSKDTIAYCRIGERSSHTWFVLNEILGYPNVKNYDGSWTEYGSLVGVPVVLGDEPGEA